MGDINKVTVIGAGIMGAGIANAIFKQGLEVKLFDIDTKLLEESHAKIKKGARRNMDPEKIKRAESFEDAVSDADLVIEAVIEDIKIKCELFAKLNELAPSHTLFASNTSSLNISEMAKASNRPDRFLGLHYFNPAVIMRLVEVVVPECFDSKNYPAIKKFIEDTKRVGIKCKESPGFVVNRILIPIINEAFQVLEKRSKAAGNDVIAVANDIDSAIQKSNILLMGPYDLADLTGIDTAYRVSEVIYNGFDKSPRYVPPAFMKKFVDEGHFGRKAKRGVYHYENQANDPDLNPCLDANGSKVERLETSEFDILDLASIMVNEAFRVYEEGIVDNIEDVETCMELGTRWPKGPFKLAKNIGLEKIRQKLEELYSKSGNDARYEPSALILKPSSELEEFFNQ